MGYPKCRCLRARETWTIKTECIEFFVTDKGGVYVTFLVPKSILAQKSRPRIFHIQATRFPLREKAYVIHGTFPFFTRWNRYTGSPLNEKRFITISRIPLWCRGLITTDLQKYNYMRWLDEKLAGTCIVSNIRRDKLKMFNESLLYYTEYDFFLSVI